MLLLILFIIYIVSFFLVRYGYRLCSSKHYGIWSDSLCGIDISWYIPILNSIAVVMLYVRIYTHIHNPNSSNKPKWKLFNWDL